MIKRHHQEMSCLDHQISFERVSHLGKEEIVRKKYLAALRLSSIMLS